MSEWIKTTERLPEDEETVLIASFGDVYVATYRAKGSERLRRGGDPGFYEHNAGYDGESDLNQYVSHWMPLPSRYGDEVMSDQPAHLGERLRSQRGKES